MGIAFKGTVDITMGGVTMGVTMGRESFGVKSEVFCTLGVPKIGEGPPEPPQPINNTKSKTIYLPRECIFKKSNSLIKNPLFGASKRTHSIIRFDKK